MYRPNEDEQAESSNLYTPNFCFIQLLALYIFLVILSFIIANPMKQEGESFQFRLFLCCIIGVFLFGVARILMSIPLCTPQERFGHVTLNNIYNIFLARMISSDTTESVVPQVEPSTTSPERAFLQVYTGVGYGAVGTTPDTLVSDFSNFRIMP